jgi:hypothetical protein
MSPFVNQQPFYPQTSLEKLPRTNSCALRQPHPYQRLPTHVLTSLTNPFYKSHAWPRFAAVPSFPPRQPGSLGLPLNFALWTWDFSCELSLWAVFSLTFGAVTWIRWAPSTDLTLPASPTSSHSLSLFLNSHSLPPGSELLCWNPRS